MNGDERIGGVILGPNARMRRLIDNAETVECHDNVPIERYYQGLKQMQILASNYIRDREMEKALILLLRFIHLAARLLPKHRAYNRPNIPNKDYIESVMIGIITTAEDLKQQLKHRYEMDFQRVTALLKQEEERRQVEEDARRVREEEEREEAYRAHMASMITRQRSLVAPRTEPTASSSNSAPPPYAKRDPVDTSEWEELLKRLPDLDARVIVAADLVPQFLEAASKNTAKDVETCGVLCGLMVNGRFVINHVILPPQTGTPNSCVSTGEIESIVKVFEAQSSREVLTFGWIHTHPSQTAFLSSVDLHTHHAYQAAMPEAVAIVCAPSHNQVGIFMLTAEGMKTIGGCQERGFHPHAENLTGQIFAQAQHTCYFDQIKGTIVDLRNSKKEDE